MNKTLISVLAAFLCCAGLGAQTLQTAYFSDNFAYSYRLNPAFNPGFSFVGLPFVGTSGSGYHGTFNVGDALFYRNGGEKVTFMNDAVSAQDFLGNFKSGLSKISSESYVNLAAIGFNASGMYNIVDFNIRGYNSAKLPYDLMRFLKEGATTDGSYDLSGLDAHSTYFAEIGITSSWKVNRKLTVGVRFKGVIGLEDSYIRLDRMTVNRSNGNWSASSDGVIASAYDGWEIATRPVATDATPQSTAGIIDLYNTEFGKPKGIMNGYGVGADLGFIYDDSSWQISGSISDIGCVFWFHNLYGHAASGTREYYSGYPDTAYHGSSTTAKEFSKMKDMLGDAFGFTKEDEDQSLGLLPLTFRFGAKYLYLNDLSFGGLATFRYDDICPYWDLRGNVNFKPTKKTELIGSVGVGSLGISMGAFASAKLGFISVFAGTDNILGGIGPKFIPGGRRSPNLAAGLNIIW